MAVTELKELYRLRDEYKELARKHRLARGARDEIERQYRKVYAARYMALKRESPVALSLRMGEDTAHMLAKNTRDDKKARVYAIIYNLERKLKLTQRRIVELERQFFLRPDKPQRKRRAVR